MAQANRGFQLDERMFRGIVLALAALMALGLMRVRFCQDVSLPAKPPEPQLRNVVVRDVARDVAADPATYLGYLERDSHSHGVRPQASLEDMSKMLPYRLDETPHELNPKGKNRSVVEAAGLRLSVSVRNIEGQPERMTVLTIENLTDQPLAYRVTTKPDRGTKVCQSKPTIVHNAMALAPGGREERSECIYRNGWTLGITRVETVALTPLGLHYVSMIPPEVVGVETRVSRGHRPSVGSTCNIVLAAATATARDQGRTTWRDLIDFFARHRCETYRFPDGYIAFTKDGERPLPVMPPQ